MKVVIKAALNLACAGWLAATAAQAQQKQPEDDLASRIISVPVPDQYRVEGVGATPASGPTNGPVRQGAARPVPGRNEQAWTVPVAVPIASRSRPVTISSSPSGRGSRRARTGRPARRCPTMRCSSPSAPYTALFLDRRRSGRNGRSTRYAVAPTVTMPRVPSCPLHLATGRQTVDIGPVFVLDMGQ